MGLSEPVIVHVGFCLEFGVTGLRFGVSRLESRVQGWSGLFKVKRRVVIRVQG
jgi:hypothetical protein